MDDPSDIDGVKAALDRHGISVARLCRRADMAESTWHRWTLGGGSPSASKWSKLLAALRELTDEQQPKAAA